MSKKGEDRLARATGKSIICPTSNWVHAQPVPCLVLRDVKGGFYAKCPHCSTMTFLKFWKPEYGLSPEQLIAAGISPPNVAV